MRKDWQVEQGGFYHHLHVHHEHFLQIPHLVAGGDDDIADFVECPWGWEKEDIESYVESLQVDRYGSCA